MFQAYRKSNEFEQFFVYMIVGAIFGVLIFVMIYVYTEDAPSVVKVGYGLLGFSIFLAFWIGTLKVIINKP